MVGDLLIKLEIMMFRKNGLSVFHEIRRAGTATPVYMPTAKGDIDNKSKRLNLGADDYLPKSFSLDDLLARVRALFRRSGGQADSMLQATHSACPTSWMFIREKNC